MPHAPIVIAQHLLWTAYGWWLPNDPRGSTSRCVASDVLHELGELHYGRKRVQPASRVIREFYEQARALLKFPLLTIGEGERKSIADAFEELITAEKYTCWACAIMPDHVHLLIRKHKHLAEDMIVRFQESSRLRLSKLGLRTTEHPVWTTGGWKVFLDNPDEVRREIKYIEDNPIKWKLPKQVHPFVKAYDGWPLHPGHSPKSPYVKRLRDRR